MEFRGRSGYPPACLVGACLLVFLLLAVCVPLRADMFGASGLAAFARDKVHFAEPVDGKTRPGKSSPMGKLRAGILPGTRFWTDPQGGMLWLSSRSLLDSFKKDAVIQQQREEIARLKTELFLVKLQQKTGIDFKALSDAQRPPADPSDPFALFMKVLRGAPTIRHETLREMVDTWGLGKEAALKDRVVTKLEDTRAGFWHETVHLILQHQNTEFAVSTHQRIAYADGGDLWIMLEDGSDARLLIAAPSGARIGRSAFSPDGTKVVYEVWETGEDRYPETSDLWIADADGGNAQLLLDAGELSEDTGRGDFEYIHRLFLGPCFSPDSDRISCLYLQVYRRPDVGAIVYDLAETQVGTVSASGGPFVPLWTTVEDMDFIGAGNPSRFVLWWYRHAGVNTSWSQDDRIAFRRSALGYVAFALAVAATNEAPAEWYAETAMGWSHEGNVEPVQLTGALNGDETDFSGAFYGYGRYVPSGIGTELEWLAHPAEAWQTPAALAWYGPIRRPVILGTNHFSFTGSDGLLDRTFTYDVVVTTNTIHHRIGSACYLNGWKQNRGVWSIGASGGTPRYEAGTEAGSVAWRPGDRYLAVDKSVSAIPLVLEIYEPDGTRAASYSVGLGTENYVGNWDAAGHRVAVCGGDGGGCTIALVDAFNGDVETLGSGEFPVFAPLFRTEVTCREGEVKVSDLDGLHTEVCGPGETVIADSLEDSGAPAPPVLIVGPYVTNVIPSWGGAVPNDTNATLTLQFSGPVDPATLQGAWLTGVTWPDSDPSGDPWLVRLAQYGALLNDDEDPNSFRGAVSNLQSTGVGQWNWNAARNEFSFTVTDPAFERTAGNWCELALDLGGVSDAGGVAAGFPDARTLFRFVDPVGSAGGTVASPSGGRITIPGGGVWGPESLSESEETVPVSIRYDDAPPPPCTEPATGSWVRAAGFHTFTAGRPLTNDVRIELALDPVWPDPAVWAWREAAWTNVGGVYNPTNLAMAVEVDRLGTFTVLSRTPSEPYVLLAKIADDTTVTNGQEVAFTALLENVGGTTATNLSVIDWLSDSFAIVPGTITGGGAYYSDEHSVEWDPADLPAGTSRWLRFSVTVTNDPPPGTLLTNRIYSGYEATTQIVAVSPVVRLHVALPPGDEARFGMGGAASTDFAGLAALGAAYRRVCATVTTTEAAGTDPPDFAWFDAQVASNQAAGLRTFAILNGAPVSNAWPTAQEMADRLFLYAERYDGDGMHDMPGLTAPVRHWQLLDAFDPDDAQWAGLTLDDYAAYLWQAAAALEDLAEEVGLLSSSFELPLPPGATNVLERLLTARPELVDVLDGVTVHSRSAETNDWNGAGSGIQYLDVGTLLASLDRVQAAGLPVWMTQADFRAFYSNEVAQGHSPTDEQNARIWARAFPFALAAGVDHLFATELTQSPAFGDALNWSVPIASNGNRRESFYVYAKMIELLEGFTDAALLDAGADAAVARFIVNGRPRWSAWNTAHGSSAIALPVGPVAQARLTRALPVAFDNTNAVWDVQTNVLVNGMLSLNLTEEPVYVEPIGVVDPDLDGDGIPNHEDDDLDGDGMSNEYEQDHGLNPFVNDAQSDLDGDGMPNGAEDGAGTDPASDASSLTIEQVADLGGEIRVTWQSVSGRLYRVSWSPDLRGSWSNAVGGAVYATGSPTVWSDTGPPRTAPFPTNDFRRFYRVTVEPR